MRILDGIKAAKAPSFAFELMGAGSLRETLETLEYLTPLKPQWTGVPTHCQNPLELCGTLQEHFRVPSVAHLTCMGMSETQIDEALEELHGYGVENVLCLQGESAAPGRYKYASNLVKHVSYSAFNFCIGVAGYPEKHFASPDFAADIAFLKAKVDAGAHYIATQMFFENRHLYDFAERCRSAGIQVPIVPGLRVLQSAEELETVPRRFHVAIPPALADGLLSNPEHAGREWAIEQARDLMRNGFPLVQFMVLNDKATVKTVADELLTP